MIQNLGVDVVEVKRIKKAINTWGDAFLKRVFTDGEIKYSGKHRFLYEHLAARFAAKEAVFKAFGNGKTKAIQWREIEILNDTHGKPVVAVHGNARKALGRNRIILSMAHTKEYAVANAAIVKR